MHPGQAKRFIVIFLISVSVSLFLTISFNWLIDPYGAFPFSPSLKKVNEIKVAQDVQQRLHKAFEIARLKPDAIFLGSSRVMCGLDPHDLKNDDYQGVYNAGFSGASSEEIYHYFEHALYHQPQLKLVVIGLDFFTFSVRNKLKTDFSFNYLQDKTLKISYLYSLLVSKTSLWNSIKTWKANRTEPSLLPPFLATGLSHPELAAGPQNPLIAKGDVEFARCALYEHYSDYHLDEGNIQAFQKLVETCQQKNIALKVFFCPPKAVYWEMIYRKGLWPVFETLKRKLCASYPIWDFSGFNEVTTEKLEGAPLYYECSHFRPYVGHLILSRLFDSNGQADRFGYLLTPDTVEEVLVRIRAERLDWLEQKPAILTQLDRVIAPLEE
jgi:hypothetical protein